jgi:hypothetical protein
MQTGYKRRPPRSLAERQFKKLEQQFEGEKAYAEYQAKQVATLENMQRLRSLRLLRERRERTAGAL